MNSEHIEPGDSSASTSEQWQVFDENYEQKDSECEGRVKMVFESPEVDLKKRYEVYEE